MKKFMAAGLSAVLCLGMVVPSYAEGTVSEEIEEIGSEFAGLGVSGELSFDGMGVSAGVSVSNTWDANGNSALSLNVNALGDSLGVEDVVRVVDGGLYVNVAGILDAAKTLTGEDLSSYTSLVGVGDWLYIPPMDFTLEGVNFELSGLDGLDSLLDDIAGKAMEAFSPISMEFTDEATVIHVTDADVTAIADNLDGIVREALAGTEEMPTVSLSFDRSFFEQFGDYVQAFAEGRAAVTGEDAAAVVEEVYGYTDLVNQYIDMMLKSFDPSEYLNDLSIRSAVDAVLAGATFDVTLTIPNEGYSCNLAGNVAGVPLDLTVAVPDNGGVTIVGSIGDGEEVIAIDVTAVPENDTTVISGTVSEGEEVLTIDGAIVQSDDGGMSYYVTLAEGETEIANVTASVTPSEDGNQIDIVYAASAGGEDLFNIVGYIAEGEDGSVSWNFDAVVEEQSLTYSGYVQETEDGVAVNCSIDLGEEGSMAVNGALHLTATPDDYVVEAPENATSLVDLVRNVTTLYYSLTAVQDSAE